MFVLIVALLTVQNLSATTVELPENTESQFADKVSVFDAKLPSDRFDDLRQVRLNIQIMASVTNAICLRFGRDGLYGTSDGKLALEETMMEIGIERNGEMYLCKNRMKDRYTRELSDPGTPQARTITFKVRVSPDNPADVKSVIFEDNGTPFSFDGLVLDPLPVEFNPVLWTDLRLLVRNGGTQSVEVKFMKDGSLIVIR